ncbi:unnamed protein product [Durusdinium trenchii]|uniref:Pentatricopeptide repeat-containing protein, chloroplastic n=1 Tax=Durusdinium trenchii TaxID=1381693 RepID=A0ABP0R499_9DINO
MDLTPAGAQKVGVALRRASPARLDSDAARAAVCSMVPCEGRCHHLCGGGLQSLGWQACGAKRSWRRKKAMSGKLLLQEGAWPTLPVFWGTDFLKRGKIPRRASESKTPSAAQRDERASSIAKTLAACRESAQWQVALQVCFQHARGSRWPRPVVLLLLGVLERSVQWQRALLALRRLRCEGEEKAVCSAMSACVQGTQWARALELLEQVTKSQAQRVGPWDLVTSTTLMAACGRGRHWRGVLKILAEIGQGCDTVSLNSAVTALASAQRWREAQGLFTLARSAGACHALLSAFETSNSWWRALALFHEAVRTQLTLSAVALNSLISACEKAGEWELALGLLDGPVRPDAITFSALTLACCQASRWRRALGMCSPVDLLGRHVLARAAEGGAAAVGLRQELLLSARQVVLGRSDSGQGQPLMSRSAASQERVLAMALLCQQRSFWWLRRAGAGDWGTIDARCVLEEQRQHLKQVYFMKPLATLQVYPWHALGRVSSATEARDPERAEEAQVQLQGPDRGCQGCLLGLEEWWGQKEPLQQ